MSILLLRQLSMVIEAKPKRIVEEKDAMRDTDIVF